MKATRATPTLLLPRKPEPEQPHERKPYNYVGRVWSDEKINDNLVDACARRLDFNGVLDLWEQVKGKANQWEFVEATLDRLHAEREKRRAERRMAAVMEKQQP